MATTRVIAKSLWLLFFALLSCDQGLAPSTQMVSGLPTGFSGLITFRNWQSADSLYDLRLVAFSVFPPGDIVNEVLQGKALVYPPLQSSETLTDRGTDSLMYLVNATAKTYPYVVVAQRYGPDLYNDWRPVGQYDLDTNLTVPSPVVVVNSHITPDIDITVDFANPPPPPFP